MMKDLLTWLKQKASRTVYKQGLLIVPHMAQLVYWL
jgi:hypothetical protein